MTIDIRKILAPVDFSDNTPSILEWTAHLAKEHGSQVVLLHAYHLPVEFQQLEGAYLPPDFWAGVRQEAEASLGRFAADLRGRGLEVEAAVCEGYAATVIVEEAAARDIDLIVIGTHGRSGIKHLLLGSIAERVVQKAPCPVLTVRAAAK
jgi:nucleotide-binding universal stress UspA family protein